MAAVADVERFLERLFERTSARLFRSRIQDVQVQRRVERAMEAGRTGRGSSTLVPNRFRVRLSPMDLDDLAGRTGGPEVLGAVLAERALAFARLHGYHLAARPSVSVVADSMVERGIVEVDASVSRAGAAEGAPGADRGQRPAAPPVVTGTGEPTGKPGVLVAVTGDDLAALVAPAHLGAPARTEAPLEPPAAPLSAPAAARETALPAGAPPMVPIEPADALPAGLPAPLPGPASSRATPPHAGLRHTPGVPYAVRPAAPTPTRAVLRLTEPGGREREVRMEERPLTLGRAPDNGLVIIDARISRHHGRFQNRHGTLVYTDLGSTNGTRVNGIRVDEIVLGPGDRIQVGDAVVVVEQLPR